MRHLVWVCSVSCGLPTTCVSTVGSAWWCVGGTAANCVQTSAVQWCQKTLYKLSQSQLTTEHSWTVAYSNSTFTAQIMTLTISVLTVRKVDSIGWVWMLSADESQQWGNEWCDIIIGVNAAGVVIPQYLTCRGHPVLMTPNILTSVSSFPFNGTSEYRKSLSFSVSVLPSTTSIRTFWMKSISQNWCARLCHLLTAAFMFLVVCECDTVWYAFQLYVSISRV